MFQDAFAGFKAQVEAVECGVAFFKFVHHAQALQVVLEAAIRGHAFVQRVLTGVAERRVT